jgi:hypothetical protein
MPDPRLVAQLRSSPTLRSATDRLVAGMSQYAPFLAGMQGPMVGRTIPPCSEELIDPGDDHHVDPAERVREWWETLVTASDAPTPTPTVVTAADPHWQRLTHLLADFDRVRLGVSHRVDVLPPGYRRRRMPRTLHRTATWAWVRYEPDPHTTATGVLATPHDGLMRLSDSVPLRVAFLSGYEAFVPGLAWKVPMLDAPSQDLLMGWSAFPQLRPGPGKPVADFNYFRLPMSNVIISSSDAEDLPSVLSAAIVERFWFLVNVWANRFDVEVRTDALDARPWFTSRPDGQPVPTPSRHHRIELRPTDEVRDACEGADAAWWEPIHRLPRGTHAWDVYVGPALDEPAAELAGQLTLVDAPRASQRADDRVYFRHNFIHPLDPG